jgi:hypothetical protein
MLREGNSYRYGIVRHSIVLCVCLPQTAHIVAVAAACVVWAEVHVSSCRHKPIEGIISADDFRGQLVAKVEQSGMLILALRSSCCVCASACRLCDTGQGLNRVQHSPQVGRAMQGILHRWVVVVQAGD